METLVFILICMGFTISIVGLIYSIYMGQKHKRKKDERLERKYRSLVTTMLSDPLIPLDDEVAVLAAEFRADLNLRTPDAVQLAAAVSRGYETLYTNDRKFERCTSINVVPVDD